MGLLGVPLRVLLRLYIRPTSCSSAAAILLADVAMLSHTQPQTKHDDPHAWIVVRVLNLTGLADLHLLVCAWWRTQLSDSCQALDVKPLASDFLVLSDGPCGYIRSLTSLGLAWHWSRLFLRLFGSSLWNCHATATFIVFP